MTTNADIAIVGGGCSGTLVAAQLLQRGFSGSIAILEPRPSLGRGLAYSTPFDGHLLNVPAGRMSAFPGDPGHFVDWLQLRGDRSGAYGDKESLRDSFLPRQLYGEYLGGLLPSEPQSNRERTVKHLRAEVVALTPGENTARLQCVDGTVIEASKIVLALGNLASSPAVPLACLDSPDLLQTSPWLEGNLDLRSPGERILLLGSGLTAIDAMMALLAQSSFAQVYMLSRNGLLPQPHAACLPPHALPGLNCHTIASSSLREFRDRIDAMRQTGRCWRPAIDALRPVSNALWQGLSLPDKQRFFRHLKSYWEPHRHRMAPEIAERTRLYRREQRLHVIAGRVRAMAHTSGRIEVTIARRDSAALLLEVDRVINCTGIHEDYNSSRRPLIRSMIAGGTASANDLGLGFHTSHGALVNRRGEVSTLLFTLGPTRRGELFETTAVPEIRVQAEELARRLMEAP